MRLVLAIVLFGSGALYATEAGKLLDTVKPASTPSSTARANANVDRMRDDLRKMLYGDRRTDPGTVFGEESAAFAQSVLLCLDEDRRVPNPDKYRGCLLGAFEAWNRKLVTLAYPDRRPMLCELPKEPPRAEFHAIGFDQRDLVESGVAALRGDDTAEAAEKLDKAILAVDAAIAKTRAGGTLRCESDSGDKPEPGTVAVDGSYCRALVARAKIYGKAGKWENGLEALDKVLRLRPLHLETLLERARALHELRRRSETITTASLVLKQAQKIGGSPFVRAEAYALRARASTAVGNLKSARSDIAQALALQPDNASYRDDLRYIDSLFQQKQ